MSKQVEIIPCPNENCEEPGYCCLCEHTGKIKVFIDKENEELKKGGGE